MMEQSNKSKTYRHGMRAASVAGIAALFLTLGGCAGMTHQDKSTIGGAAIGGVAGSVLGGGALGTVGGAAVGGVIGHEVGK